VTGRTALLEEPDPEPLSPPGAAAVGARAPTALGVDEVVVAAAAVASLAPSGRVNPKRQVITEYHDDYYEDNE
jgi:hypothetical protein